MNIIGKKKKKKSHLYEHHHVNPDFTKEFFEAQTSDLVTENYISLSDYWNRK